MSSTNANAAAEISGLRGSKRSAWMIHLFTMSGVVLGLKALQSIAERRPKDAMLWMLIAMVVDGIDGPLARSFNVREHVPILDGNSLDLMIDFLACVVAPAFFVRRFHMLPHSTSLFFAAVIMLSGVIWMSRTDMLTLDDYFVGFPAMWNIVVTLLYLLGTNHTINVAAIIFFAVISFTKIKFVHPVRTRDFRQLTIGVMSVWLAVQIFLIVDLKSSDKYDADGPHWAKAIVLAGTAYHAFLVIRRTRMKASNETKSH